MEVSFFDSRLFYRDLGPKRRKMRGFSREYACCSSLRKTRVYLLRTTAWKRIQPNFGAGIFSSHMPRPRSAQPNPTPVCGRSTTRKPTGWKRTRRSVFESGTVARAGNVDSRQQQPLGSNPWGQEDSFALSGNSQPGDVHCRAHCQLLCQPVQRNGRLCAYSQSVPCGRRSSAASTAPPASFLPSSSASSRSTRIFNRLNIRTENARKAMARINLIAARPRESGIRRISQERPFSR
jgi:hypothetical protein